MGERLDVEVVGRIDIFTDLEHHRQRCSGSEIGANDVGEALADRIGDPARIPVPVRKIGGIGQEVLCEFSEGIGSVLPFEILELGCRRSNVLRAAILIHHLLKSSTVD